MPKPTVAILGASSNRDKFGNKSVRAHLKAGYEVFPVNPRADQIEGLRCYATIADVPEPIDRVSFYLPPSIGLSVINDVAAKHPKEIFLNPGSESLELIERARRLGLNVIQACSIVDVGFHPGSLES